eukprot:PLAT6096.2.p1 GENE.PLAT6096.2~~PLAT6096.2.p1  ORF type:complete len:433 (-),score=169.82 PLAT6096.2:53-1351(-)
MAEERAMTILALPDEVLHAVFHYLPWQDLLSLACTTKLMSSLATDEALWESSAKYDYPSEARWQQEEKQPRWRSFCRQQVRRRTNWEAGKLGHWGTGTHDTIFSITVAERDFVLTCSGDGELEVGRLTADGVEHLGGIGCHTAPSLGFSYCPETKRALVGGVDGALSLWKINVDAHRRLNIGSMGVREMRDWLDARGVSYRDCVEKKDIVQRLRDTRAVRLGEQLRVIRDAHGGNIVSTISHKQLLISSSHDCLIKLWDADSGECKSELAGSPAEIESLFYSEAAALLLSGNKAAQVQLWDVERGETTGSLAAVHGAWVWALHTSPDGRQAWSGDARGEVFGWDLRAPMAPVAHVQSPIAACVAGMSFDQDVLAVSSFDGAVRLYTPELRQFDKPLVAVRGSRLTRCFMQKNGCILAGSLNAGWHVWHADWQ